MPTNDSLITSAEQYVTQLFSDQVPAAYHFHDLHHTLAVVAAAGTIAANYSLSEQEHTALLLAAWFHDTGYSRQYEGHESVSVQIAGEFLKARHVDDSLISSVKGCIMATRMPQSPNTIIEEILCDSDLYHLGTDQFEKENKLLRKELNVAFGKDISKKTWRKLNIRFLQQHHFFTSFGREHLQPVQDRHLKELMEKDKGNREEIIEKREPEIEESEPLPEVEQPIHLRDKAKREKDKLNRTERGIATMFRIMSDNHVSLSQMADSKANIMISVNTIVLSILVSVLIGKLQYYPQFIIPTIILSCVCLLAVVFAIMATRPNVTKGVFTEEDIREKKVNLLFFGNFFKMNLNDYEWGMKEMMNDREYLYGSMIKDIYYLGKVLARKYHFLRLSYNIFMFGLIIAVISFGIASFMGMK
jgi:predicted metal-dependent HD superfamily phosphohydrolase